MASLSKKNTASFEWIRINIRGIFFIAVVVFLLQLGIPDDTRISPVVFALLLGILLSNFGINGTWSQPSLALVAGPGLKIGIALLGFRSAFSDIAKIGNPFSIFFIIGLVFLVFVGVSYLGHLIGVKSRLVLLIAAGFSICGISAIASTRPLTNASDEETGYAIGLVTLFGSLSVLFLPLFGELLLDLEANHFGWWVGISVYDTGQVVAAASIFSDQALDTAIVVKICRVLMLGPLLLVLSIFLNSSDSTKSSYFKIPSFVIAFIVFAILRSVIEIPEKLLDFVANFREFLILAAMFGLGAGIKIRTVVKLGNRPLLLGILCWGFFTFLTGFGIVGLSKF